MMAQVSKAIAGLLLAVALNSCAYVQLLTAKPTISYHSDTGKYSLNGPITFDTAGQLSRTVPSGSVLTVTSVGGRSDVARRIADWAVAENVTLVITGTCASACANTLAASRQAQIEAGAALLFHGSGEDDTFYLQNGKNPRFIQFADKATKYIYQQRSKADKREKLIGVAVPYFWVPSRDELRCFGIEADVKGFADFKPESKASGSFFTTADLPGFLKEELKVACLPLNH